MHYPIFVKKNRKRIGKSWREDKIKAFQKRKNVSKKQKKSVLK
jgi:hypothetical protein